MVSKPAKYVLVITVKILGFLPQSEFGRRLNFFSSVWFLKIVRSNSIRVTTQTKKEASQPFILFQESIFHDYWSLSFLSTYLHTIRISLTHTFICTIMLQITWSLQHQKTTQQKDIPIKVRQFLLSLLLELPTILLFYCFPSTEKGASYSEKMPQKNGCLWCYSSRPGKSCQ